MPDRSPAERPSIASVSPLVAIVIEVTRTIRALAVPGAWVGGAYWAFRAIEVLAGRVTAADIGVGVRVFADIGQ